MIPQRTIDAINARTDLLQVIGEHVPDLKKAGANYKGTSPWNPGERSPSFNVNLTKGIWKDFSSGNGGNDAASFLMKLLGWSFPEAMAHLAERAGVELESTDGGKEAQRIEGLRIVVQAALGLFRNHYQGSTSQAAMAARAIGEGTADAWEIGHAEGKLLDFFQKHQYNLEDAVAAGLLKRNESGQLYDFFRGRTIFPIYDRLRRCVGFAGRRVGEQGPKYINSPQSDLYDKSSLLYGLHLASQHIREAGFAILVEGYTDGISLHQAGVKQAVGTCGTALTEGQIRQLGNLANHVVIMRDGDTAGQDAAERDVQLLLKSNLACSVVLLPEGQDPDDLVRQGGSEAIAEAMKAKVEGITFLARRWKTSNEPKAVADLLRRLGEVLKSIPWDVERDLYVKHLAEQLRQPASLVARAAGMEVETKLGGSRYRQYHEYLNMCGALNVRPCPDFEAAPDGGVMMPYRTLSGEPLTLSRGKAREAAVSISTKITHPKAAYIPPALRELAQRDEQDDIRVAIRQGTLPLVVCEGEMLADWLCEIGLCAVGFPKIDACISARGANAKLHHTLTPVIEKLGFRRLVLVIPDWAMQVPNMPIDETAEDAGRLASTMAEVLRDWERATREFQTWVWRRPLVDPWPNGAGSWLENLLFAWDVEQGSVQGVLAGSISPGFDHKGLYVEEITAGTPAQFEKLLCLHSPEAFYHLHGYEKLGRRFRLGSQIYQLDGSGSAVVIDEDAPLPEVFESGGTFKARTRGGGIIRLTNWTVKCEMEVKESENSFGIYLFRNTQGQECRSIVSDADFHSKAAFLAKVRMLPGKFYAPKLAEAHLPQIQEMVNMQAPLATTLGRDLGLYEPAPDADGTLPEPFYVWGNGITTTGGAFIPADPQGVLDYAGRQYFLPAASAFLRQKKGHEKKYKNQLGMSHGSGGAVAWEAWLRKYLLVNTEKAHVPVFFYIASIYADLFTRKFARFPILYLQGRRAAGKGVMVETLSALFGAVDVLNFENNNTLPAITYQPNQVRNGLAVFNEFNLDTVTQKYKGILELLKGWYDRQGRKRMAGSHTTETQEATIESIIVMMGQQSIKVRDELDTRFITVELPDREDSTRSDAETGNYYDLMEMGRDGQLCHLTDHFFAQRDLVARHLDRTVQEIEQKLKRFPAITRATARLHQNWALVLAPLLILVRHDRIKYPLDENELLVLAADNIALQLMQGNEGGKAAMFWQWVAQAIYQQRIDDRVVFVTEGQDANGNKTTVLRLQFGNAFPMFEDWLRQTRRSTEIQNYSSQDMKTYLMQHPAFLREKKKNLHIGWRRNAQGQPYNPAERRLTSGLEFIYDAIGIDLDQANLEGLPAQDVPAAVQYAIHH